MRAVLGVVPEAVASLLQVDPQLVAVVGCRGKSGPALGGTEYRLMPSACRLRNFLLQNRRELINIHEHLLACGLGLANSSGRSLTNETRLISKRLAACVSARDGHTDTRFKAEVQIESKLAAIAPEFCIGP